MLFKEFVAHLNKIAESDFVNENTCVLIANTKGELITPNREKSFITIVIAANEAIAIEIVQK